MRDIWYEKVEKSLTIVLKSEIMRFKFIFLYNVYGSIPGISDPKAQLKGGPTQKITDLEK